MGSEMKTVTEAPTVTTTKLIKSLMKAKPACERLSTIPILSHFKLSAKNNMLTITCTNLDIGIIVKTPFDGDLEGRAVSANQLLACLRALPKNSEVEIAATKNFGISVKAGSFKATLPGMSPESYPSLPDTPVATVPLPGADLKRLCQQTTRSISMEGSRFTLNGALLTLKAGVLELASTDGHRAHVAQAPVALEGELKNLIHKRALVILTSMGDVEFSADDSHYFFATPDMTLISRKLSGKFPDLNTVLRDQPIQFAFSVPAAMEAILAVRVFADKRAQAMNLVFSAGVCRLSVGDVVEGSAESSFPCEYAGEDFETRLNHTYVTDALACVGGPSAIWGLTERKSSVEISAPGFRCILMPMR